MSKKQQSITALPLSPDEERRGRVIRYTVAMSVRVVCVILAIVLTGWVQIAAIIGAIVLPYVAVVVANVKMRETAPTVVRPGAYGVIERRDPTP